LLVLASPILSGSLRLGLLLRLVALLCLLLALDALACYYTALHFANLVYDRWLIDSNHSIATAVRTRDGRVEVDLPHAALEVFQFDEVDTTYYRIDSAQQGLIAGEPALTPIPNVPQGQVRLADSRIGGHPVRVVSSRLALPAADSNATISVAETLIKRLTLTREIVLAMVAPQVALLAVALSLAWLNVNRALKPLTDLAQAIESRGHDNLTPVSEVNLPMEARVLAARLNELFERVNTAMQSQERFVGDAAHQLRTPLAAVVLHADAAERAGSQEAQRRELRSLRVSADRAARLSQQLLVLMRAGPAAAVARFVPLDLAALVRRVGEEWVPQMLLRGVDFGLAVPETAVMVSGDESLLGELLSNLLDNALRYGQSEGRVTLGVSRSPHNALYVEDDGPGIALAEQERIFERFYRTPGTTGEGCGLGLSIVKQIAELHQAAVSIRSDIASARFTVSFPRLARLDAPGRAVQLPATDIGAASRFHQPPPSA
jgi:two-component system, OmpR family, sensor histidine kinase TctE